MAAMPIDVPAIIQDQAAQSGVDPDLALAIILHGENSSPTAVSPKGAIGEGQLMPATARSLGVDPTNREQNLRGSVRYMAQIQNELGTTDPSLIAAGYNAGPGAVRRAGGVVPNYPETQAYVKRVNAAMPSKNPAFADSDFDSASPDNKSGASQGQNFSAAAPQFADSDFEAGSNAQPASGPVRDMSVGGQVKRALGLTARDVLEGATKTLGIVGDPANYIASKVTGAPYSSVSATGGQLADKLGLPSPEGTAENVVNTAGQALVGTGGQATIARGLGGLVKNPIIAGALGQLYSNMAGQAGGAITGSVASSGSHALGQSLNLNPYAQQAFDFTAGLGGGMVGGGMAGRYTNGITDPNLQTTLNAADQSKIPVQLSDVNPSWASAMRLAGKLPFGTGTLLGGNKAPQQVAGVRDALANAAEQYRPDGLNPTSGARGTDRFLANDLRQVATQRQAASDALYKTADSIAKQSNLPPIEAPQLQATASDLWSRYPDALRGLEIDAKSNKFLQALKPQEAAPEEPQMVNVGGVKMDWGKMSPGMKSALSAQGIEPEAAPEQEPLTFQNLNDLRTSIGDVLGQAKQAAVSGGQSRTKIGIFSQMYKAITDDIDGYLNRSDVPPELGKAVGAAQDNFKQNILPLRDDGRINQVLASHPGTDGVDEAAQGLHQYIFGANKGETSQKYLSMLSPAGQQAAAYQAIKSATDSALSTSTEEGLKSATGLNSLRPSPALDNIAAANPGMSDDVARLQALLRLGRTAATNQASKGVLTGFQTRDLGSIYAIGKAADALEHHGLSSGAAYTTAAGVPLAAGNITSLLNSRLPNSLRNYFLANPGALSSRTIPGLLAAQMQDNK